MGHVEGMEGEVRRRKGMVKYTPPSHAPPSPFSPNEVYLSHSRYVVQIINANSAILLLQKSFIYTSRDPLPFDFVLIHSKFEPR